MTLGCITRACDFNPEADAFVRKLVSLGFGPPGDVTISSASTQMIADRINLSIRNECLRLEVGRRALVSAVLQPMLDQFEDIACFQEEICTSGLFSRQGPVDFLVASFVPLFRRRPHVKCFVVECKADLNDQNVADHIPQWVGEMSAVMNGGDYSQGALTDGFNWWFAILTRDDPKHGGAPALKKTTRVKSSIRHSASTPTKPKLTLSLSPCINVIGPSDVINEHNLRLVCQCLHLCFSRGFLKMADSHLLVDLPSSDETEEAAALVVHMAAINLRGAGPQPAASAAASAVYMVRASPSIMDAVNADPPVATRLCAKCQRNQRNQSCSSQCCRICCLAHSKVTCPARHHYHSH